jgi:hypothetical protein
LAAAVKDPTPDFDAARFVARRFVIAEIEDNPPR